jgi:hypothetical protein
MDDKIYLYNPLLILINILMIVTVPAYAKDNLTEKTIQSQLDSSSRVILSDGIYTISSPIILNISNQLLKGNGLGTVLKLNTNANCPVLIIAHASGETISDLSIDGNKDKQQDERWNHHRAMNDGIIIVHSTNIFIENVSIDNCRSGGLVSTGSKRLHVHNLTSFENRFDGLACYGTSDSKFSGLFLHDNLAAGISLDNNFHDNFIGSSDVSKNSIGIFMRNSTNNKFQNIIMKDNKSFGIFMASDNYQPNTGCNWNSFTNVIINNSKVPVRINDNLCLTNNFTRI